VEQNPSLEADSHSASQEISLLLSPNVHYRVHTIPSHPISVRYILILTPHLRLGLSSGLFPSGFPIKTFYAFLMYPMHATCPHLVPLNLITVIILGEAYKL